MLDNFYSLEQRKGFFGRENYLKQLESIKPKTAILGNKGTGKDFLLKEALFSIKAKQKRTSIVYIDFEKIVTSPEKFSIAFISQISSFVLNKKITPEIASLLSLEKEIGIEPFQAIKKIENETEKIQPKQALILEQALKFPELLAKEKSIKIVIGVREFLELLSINNFPQIKDVLSIFSSINYENVSWIVTSSLSTQFKKENLFFSEINLTGFTEKETKSYIEKNKLSYNDKIFSFSAGYPCYLTPQLGIFNKKDFNKQFARALTDKNSLLHNVAKNNLSYYLSNARGKALLFDILKLLSQKKSLRLNEISKGIYRSAPVTKAVLERAMEVDIVIKEDSKFMIKDPLLSYFIDFNYNQIGKTAEEIANTIE